MGAGKRRQIRIKIEQLVTEYMECYVRGLIKSDSEIHALAGDIMRLFPKSEVTVIYRKETTHFKVPYYKCGKCGGLIEYVEWHNYFKFCPCCGRRILAVEDDTLWQ